MITKKELATVECGEYHSGDHSFTWGYKYHQCKGCGKFVSHEQVKEALERGKTKVQHAVMVKT